MLVFCEECGKKYSFPPEKIDPKTGTFRCKQCKFLMPAAIFQSEGYKMNQQSAKPKSADSSSRKK
jgi:hypothetical protein